MEFVIFDLCLVVLSVLGLVYWKVSFTEQQVLDLCKARHSLAGILSDPPFTKSQLEEEVFDLLKEDPKCKNTSRDDVRNVMRAIGVKLSSITDSQAIAMTRQIRNW